MSTKAPRLRLDPGALAEQARKDVEAGLAQLSPGARGMVGIVADGQAAKGVVAVRVGRHWKVATTFAVAKRAKPEVGVAVVGEW